MHTPTYTPASNHAPAEYFLIEERDAAGVWRPYLADPLFLNEERAVRRCTALQDYSGVDLYRVVRLKAVRGRKRITRKATKR